MRPLLIALTALIASTGPAATAAAQDPQPSVGSFVSALDGLDARLTGSLSAGQRASFHAQKAKLVARYYGETFLGVTFADVLRGLDCVATSLQRARGATSRSVGRKLVIKGKSCHKRLTSNLRAGTGVPAALLSDLAKIGAGIDAIAKAQRAGKAFGAKATALRKTATSFVKRHFDRVTIGEVRFPEAYADLECADVKVESGRVTGARSCIRRLRRLVRVPPSAPVTFGSDLTGDPVAIPGKYSEDNAWWTDGLTVPADGRVTAFKLRVGANPIDLPIRFTIVRPQPGGKVRVVTTSDPPFNVPANSPGTYTFETSGLSFRCCNALNGDIVTIAQRGADQTQDPYVWFARKSGFTTFGFLSTAPGARALDPGYEWTPNRHEGYDVLLQAVVSPS